MEGEVRVRVFLKWLLPEGRLNSGASGERDGGVEDAKQNKKRRMERSEKKRCSRKINGEERSGCSWC